MRDLRNHTARVVDAVRPGERVTLTVRGEPIADIVPHLQREHWISGPALEHELASRQADADLARDLDALAADTLDEN